MIKNTNIPAMEQAVQVIFDMSADTALRERARLREKVLFDEVSAMKGVREERLKQVKTKNVQQYQKKCVTEE